MAVSKLGEDKYDIRGCNTYAALANSSNQKAGPGITIKNARKQHVHGIF